MGNVKAERFRQSNQPVQQDNAKSVVMSGLEAITNKFIEFEHELNETKKEISALRLQLNTAMNQARAADYRSLALEQLGTIDKSKIISKVLEIQGNEFDEASKKDDKARKLLNIDDQPASKGMIAITSIKMFKDNREVPELRIVRTKNEIGKEEIFPGLDEAIEGLKVGESRRFDVKIELMGITQAEVHLIGLRKEPV